MPQTEFGDGRSAAPGRGGRRSVPALTSARAGRDLEAGQFRRLELVSMAEAMTLLLLLGFAVPLKHLAGWAAGVTVLGPLHGLVFLFYLWTLLQTVSGGGWSGGEIARLFLASLVPFGGFANLGLLRRKLDALHADRPA